MQTFAPSKKISLGEAFAMPALTQVEICSGESGGVNVPPLEEYSFDKDRLGEFFVFWQSGLKALKLKGDPAAGKTSLVSQWHARLNWPLYTVSCNDRTTADDLIGQFIPQGDGKFKFFYGAVARAAMEGVSVLLDEGNALEPNAMLALHMLMEGYPVYVPQTGETIYPQPNFRVFFTENCLASKLAVAGRHLHDASTDDRFMEMKVDYLRPEVETLIVKRHLSNVGMPAEQQEMVAGVMVKMANRIRNLYHADDSAIVKPMSTRVLTRWAKLAWGFRGVAKRSEDPLLFSLERAFGGQTPEMWKEVKNEYLKIAG